MQWKKIEKTLKNARNMAQSNRIVIDSRNHAPLVEDESCHALVHRVHWLSEQQGINSSLLQITDLILYTLEVFDHQEELFKVVDCSHQGRKQHGRCHEARIKPIR